MGISKNLSYDVLFCRQKLSDVKAKTMSKSVDYLMSNLGWRNIAKSRIHWNNCPAILILIFRKPLRKFFDKNTDSVKAGRQPYDYVVMFKILILQRYYNLSDDHTEYAIVDRLSFMRFLGMGINQPVPAAKTIWLFRDKLTGGGMLDKLFRLLDQQLDKDGIIVHPGKLVDASIVEVPIQRNTGDENKELK